MIYDHERDAESPVADWGGDELFTSVPRRRFKHSASRPRRYSGPVTGAHTLRRPEPVPAVAPTTPDGGHDGRVHAAEATRVGGVAFPSRAGHASGATVEMPKPLPLPPAVAKAVAEQVDPVASFVADLAPGAEGAPVTDAGDTEPSVAPWPRRRREVTPIQDRIAVRPDRIAGWAVALGITLILIAVGTADGGAI